MTSKKPTAILDAGGLVQLSKGELRRSINCDEKIKLALPGANFGDGDVEVADWIA